MKPRRKSRPRRAFVPHFLVLEDRTVLSVLTVMNNADSGHGSLRAAIAAAQSGDTIAFDPSLAHETTTLTSSPLALGSTLTIDGLGASQLAISGNNASQLFTLSGSAQVTLDNLTLTGGMSSQGGAIFIGGTAALTLDNDILSGNQAISDANGNALGGAVYTSARASLMIDNTAFVNDQTNGTNVSFGGAIANAGSLSVNGVTFTNNAALGSITATGYPQPGGSEGGAIGNLDGSTSTIALSTFCGNQALGTSDGDAQGGAICNENAWDFPFTGSGVTCKLSQCTFKNNTAEGGSDSGITGGTASNWGGGAIEDQPGANLAVLNCTFTGNQANSGGGSSAVGGAIDNSPSVTIAISGSQFINNSALGSSQGAIALAGAVDNLQTMTIARCIFSGNSAVAGTTVDGVNSYGQAYGGALETEGSGVILTISDSMVTGNEAIGGSGSSTQAFRSTGLGAGGGIADIGGGILTSSDVS
jgi:hypothetical protein